MPEVDAMINCVNAKNAYTIPINRIMLFQQLRSITALQYKQGWVNNSKKIDSVYW